MIRYEYRVDEIQQHDRGSLESALNLLGDMGWELVQITPYHFIMKREALPVVELIGATTP